MNAQQVIDEMECRFRSEDGQPIYAVHITREEWEAVMQHMRRAEDDAFKYAMTKVGVDPRMEDV